MLPADTASFERILIYFQEYCYKVYSLDFDDLTGRNLMLQAVWKTEHGWRRNMKRCEILKVKEYKYNLYFSLEEFVLTGKAHHSARPLRPIAHVPQAQLELKEWLQCYVNEKFNRIIEGNSGLTLEKFMENFDPDLTVRKTGFIYDLFLRNCQHFAESLYKNILRRDWWDERREERPWDADLWRPRPLRRQQEPKDEKRRSIKKSLGPATMLIFSLVISLL